jgi:hypothetical protein
LLILERESFLAVSEYALQRGQISYDTASPLTEIAQVPVRLEHIEEALLHGMFVDQIFFQFHPQSGFSGG